MDDIYILLVKHFKKATSDEEEEKITVFKTKNEKEYHLLKQLWLTNKQINLIPNELEGEWRKLKRKINEKTPPKVISIRKHLGWTAAIAAIFILGFMVFNSEGFNNEQRTESIRIEENTTDSIQEILFADGSTVWLNKGARIEYPENFSGKVRKVSLTGQAYFNIAKNKEKPFIVETKISDITVLGTSFNVISDSLSSTVSLTTGKVQIVSAVTKESVIIKPGISVITTADEQLTYSSEANYMAWKTGIFTFNETPLKKVFEDLSSYYTNKIIIDEEIGKQVLTAEFKKIPIEEIIDLICFNHNLDQVLLDDQSVQLISNNN